MSRQKYASQYHDFGAAAPVEDVAIPCLTCGVEVMWKRSEDDRITSLYRKPPADWSKDRPRCHEQTGLFG